MYDVSNEMVVGDVSSKLSRLPTPVGRLLEKTSMLESLVIKLERSKQQLVSLMGEQSQEIRGLREDIATSRRQDGDADANDGGPQAVTLLVGNSLLRNVRVDKTSSGNPIEENQAPLSQISNK
ncbi:hypothetical protein NP493_1054g00035 [Ridgeia piscesae]|uniref:Uncharacterized protein n=1 Tax=Ridgeia piscesae TaxID=27915 RepID=A0AAD9NIR7_RIDPI|nr:hypothetical protein NP493_1054g00035 [Ridgeia piscesae]